MKRRLPSAERVESVAYHVGMGAAGAFSLSVVCVFASYVLGVPPQSTYWLFGIGTVSVVVFIVSMIIACAALNRMGRPPTPTSH